MQSSTHEDEDEEECRLDSTGRLKIRAFCVMYLNLKSTRVAWRWQRHKLRFHKTKKESKKTTSTGDERRNARRCGHVLGEKERERERERGQQSFERKSARNFECLQVKFEGGGTTRRKGNNANFKCLRESYTNVCVRVRIGKQGKKKEYKAAIDDDHVIKKDQKMSLKMDSKMTKADPKSVVKLLSSLNLVGIGQR